MKTISQLTAKDIIQELNMQPHPEGGHYVQTFKDPFPTDEGQNRAASTAIYYILERGEKSHWHRVIDASEVWLWHGGASLELSIFDETNPPRTEILGMDIMKGERPHVIIPRNVWQSARSTGDWTLVSCTVAPGFEFSSFEMAAPDWQPPK